MVKQRIIETNEGIQSEITVEIFDRFSKNMRDKGWNNVDFFIESGVANGDILEIGPGPGYVGLEWLKKTKGTTVTGCEISPAMIRMAEKNAGIYGLTARARYVEGNGMDLPFLDKSFDAVISNGSLHEWEDPRRVFGEIARVLKPGGVYCISDMRRDVSPLITWPIYLTTKPKDIRPGFISSLNAAYTLPELQNILSETALKDAHVKKDFFGLSISGTVS